MPNFIGVTLTFSRRYKTALVAALFLIWSAPGHAPNIYWKMWKIDTLGNGADGVHIGDINRDGLVDVVSGWEQSGDLMLYFNPGPELVRDEIAWSQVDISGGLPIKGIEDAAFADFDLDGFDDAIISSIEGDTRSLGIHWFEGDDMLDPDDWRGVYMMPEELAGYMKARVAQIDGVAGADIVAGSRSMDGVPAGVYWQWRRVWGIYDESAHNNFQRNDMESELPDTVSW